MGTILRQFTTALFLFFCLPASFAFPATTTAAPRVLIRDGATLGPEAIGYTSTFGTFSIWHCPISSIWITVGEFGRCCTDNTKIDCFMPTSCEGSIFSNDRFKSTCTGTGYQLSCVTGTIFATPGDPSPVSNYQCWPSWTDGNWEATRSVPLSTSMPSPSSTSAPVLLTISSSQPSSSTALTRPKGSGGSGPNGKLIGSIVGPILGFFAVAGIVALFVIRCLQNKKRLREERNMSTIYIDYAGNEFHIKQPGHWTERAFSTSSTSPVVDGNVSPVSPTSQVHVEPTWGVDR